LQFAQLTHAVSEQLATATTNHYKYSPIMLGNHQITNQPKTANSKATNSETSCELSNNPLLQETLCFIDREMKLPRTTQ
jgi:hypothetical protein